MKILIYGSDTTAVLLATLFKHSVIHDTTFVTGSANHLAIKYLMIDNPLTNGDQSSVNNSAIRRSATQIRDLRTKNTGACNIINCDDNSESIQKINTPPPLSEIPKDLESASAPNFRFDLIILTVPMQHTATTIDKVAPYLDKEGILLSIQPGVHNFSNICEHFNSKQIMIGVPQFGTTFLDRSTVYIHRGSTITIGSPNIDTYHDMCTPPNYATSIDAFKVLKLFEDIYKATGVLNLSISQDIKVDLWIKLMTDIAYYPLSGLLDATRARLNESDLTKEIMIKLCSEVAAVAKESGVIITENDVDNVLTVSNKMHDGETSFSQDIKNNIKPDIHSIFNELASSVVPTPTIDLLYNLAQFKFGGWFHTFPRLAADVLVVNGDKVLLIERRNPPYGWAIPGGFADYGEKIEHTAMRELNEETGIDVTADQLNLLDIYSDPSRDKRGHIATAVYFVYGDWVAIAADDALDAKYFNFDSLPKLAFDHDKVISDYVKRHHTK